MNDTRAMTESTIDQVSAALNQLNAGCELSDKECNSVISSLRRLRTKADTDKNANMMSETKEIDRLLEEFNTYAGRSREMLESLLASVSDGKVPYETEMILLKHSIDKLRNQYKTLYEYTNKCLFDSERLKEGLPAADYVKAVKRHEIQLYEKQIKEILDLLKAFISVYSAVHNYTIALQPYQEHAQELVSKLSGNDKIDIEEIQRELEGPKIFLETMNCVDIDSDEGMALLDRVSEYYPRRIQNGLAAGKYCFSTQITAQESNVDENHEESSQPVSNNNLGWDLLLKDVGPIGTYTKDISLNQEKKITARVFQNDIRNGSENEWKAIVQEIADKNVVTVKGLSVLIKATMNLAEFSLESFFRKGYLCKHKLVPGGEFYSASDRLKKALTYKDAAKAAGVRRFYESDWYEPSIENDKSAACRLAYDNLYYDIIMPQYDNDIYLIDSSGRILTNCFIGKSRKRESKNPCDVIAGAFCDTAEECDAYFSKVQSILENEDEVNSFIFAGPTKIKAMVFATVMLNKLGNSISYKRVYIYGFTEGAYSTYPEMTAINAESVKVGI